MLGSLVVDTTSDRPNNTVVDLLVSLDLDTPADRFDLVLGQVNGVHPARDQEAKIELGYADNGGLTQVMAGRVDSVEPNLVTTRVVGYSGFAAALRTHVDQTYQDKSAGDLVRDLAQRAGLQVAAADDGIRFPAYVVDGRRSVYQHMRDLADLSGFDLYVDPTGRLLFKRFAGGETVHVFGHGQHVVGFDLLRTPPAAGRVEAWGESPAGSGGTNAWAWLTKDFQAARGTAGSGAVRLLERSALRTIPAARTAAEAALTAIRRRTVRGELRLTGQPAVKLGDAFRLSGMPDEALNTRFQVRAVTHRVTKRGGFTTTVGFRAIEV